MYLRDEIVPYLDKDGLVEPAAGRPSNNGVMYTSEYIIMLSRRKQLTEWDVWDYLRKINLCMPKYGLLQRNPANAGGQEGPDDYIALAAALHELDTDGSKKTAKGILNYGFTNLGFMNNEIPGTWTGKSWMVRQPQLVAAFLWAAGYPVGPLIRLWCFVTLLIPTLFPKPTSDVDSRRLAWLLLQVAKKQSWSCNWVSKYWYKRLYKDYGPDGMRAVARIGYEPGHPFATYWVD